MDIAIAKEKAQSFSRKFLGETGLARTFMPETQSTGSPVINPFRGPSLCLVNVYGISDSDNPGFRRVLQFQYYPEGCASEGFFYPPDSHSVFYIASFGATISFESFKESEVVKGASELPHPYRVAIYGSPKLSSFPDQYMVGVMSGPLNEANYREAAMTFGIIDSQIAEYQEYVKRRIA